MSKFISFFRTTAPLKLIALSLGIALVSYFIQKPLPNIFMGLRLLAFILFVYATIRFINKR